MKIVSTGVERAHRVSNRRLVLLASCALTTLATALSPAWAQEPGAGGKIARDSAVRAQPIGKNTESETAADKPAIPFMISVDGETVEQSGLPENAKADRLAPGETRPSARPVDQQRKTDLDLAAVDIQVKFDGLEAGTLLNVSTVPVKRTYRAGDEVRFLATSNYPAFIERSEIRIFEAGEAAWVMPQAEKS